MDDVRTRTRPHGGVRPARSSNSKWFLDGDGHLSLAEPDHEGRDAKTVAYVLKGDRLTVDFGGRRPPAAFRVESESRERWMLASESGVRTRMCRPGDRAAFDRPIAPYSIASIVATEDERANEFPAEHASPAPPPADVVEGAWEIVRVTRTSLADAPPYGFNNLRVAVANGQVCLTNPDGSDEGQPPRCAPAVYGRHTSPDGFRLSRGAWGYLVIEQGGERYEARWLQADTRHLPVLPLRVVLLESGG